MTLLTIKKNGIPVVYNARYLVSISHRKFCGNEEVKLDFSNVNEPKDSLVVDVENERTASKLIEEIMESLAGDSCIVDIDALKKGIK